VQECTTACALSDSHHFTVCDLHEICSRELEDRMRSSCSSPDLLNLKKIFVDEDLHGFGKAGRRDTADGESRVLSNKVRIGFPHRFGEKITELFFVYAVGTACNDKNGSSRCFPLEHQRLCNLLDATADSLSRFLRGSGRAGQFYDLTAHPVAVQSVLDFLCTFAQRFRHERKYNTVTSELGMEKATKGQRLEERGKGTKVQRHIGTKGGGTKGYRRMGFLLCASVPMSLKLFKGEFVFSEKLKASIDHIRGIKAAPLVLNFLQRFIQT